MSSNLYKAYLGAIRNLADRREIYAFAKRMVIKMKKGVRLYAVHQETQSLIMSCVHQFLTDAEKQTFIDRISPFNYAKSQLCTHKAAKDQKAKPCDCFAKKGILALLQMRGDGGSLTDEPACASSRSDSGFCSPDNSDALMNRTRVIMQRPVREPPVQVVSPPTRARTISQGSRRSSIVSSTPLHLKPSIARPTSLSLHRGQTCSDESDSDTQHLKKRMSLIPTTFRTLTRTPSGSVPSAPPNSIKSSRKKLRRSASLIRRSSSSSSLTDGVSPIERAHYKTLFKHQLSDCESSSDQVVSVHHGDKPTRVALPVARRLGHASRRKKHTVNVYINNTAPVSPVGCSTCSCNKMTNEFQSMMAMMVQQLSRQCDGIQQQFDDLQHDIVNPEDFYEWEDEIHDLNLEEAAATISKLDSALNECQIVHDGLMEINEEMSALKVKLSDDEHPFVSSL